MQNLYLELVKHFGTQEVAAQAIGVKQSTINGYLKGKWNMSEKVAIRTQKLQEVNSRLLIYAHLYVNLKKLTYQKLNRHLL